jgi:hypothetical protein
VIALENLVIALLAQVTDRQLDLARQMASYISPRAGFTRHRPTIRAAAQMVHLAERADHFRRTANPHDRPSVDDPGAAATAGSRPRNSS